MSAATQMTRIVQMVAELGRRERRGEEAATIDEIATSLGVTPKTVAADIRTLTVLGEHSADDWLLSLSVWQQDDRLSVSSGGPFRRPLVLTPMERCALQVALMGDPDGARLAERLEKAMAGAPAPAEGGHETDEIRRTVEQAVEDRLRIALDYAGEGEEAARTWTLEPHQTVEYRDRVYLVAWSPEGWRHFRLDRASAVRSTGSTFEPRADFREVLEPGDLFRPAPDQLETVVVRFAPGLGRWVRSRYPEHRMLDDGRVEVDLPVASEAWLVRRVLDHGPDAEVVSPARYRSAVRRALA